MLEFHTISGDITVRCTETIFFLKKWNAIEPYLWERGGRERGRYGDGRNGNINNFQFASTFLLSILVTLKVNPRIWISNGISNILKQTYNDDGDDDGNDDDDDDDDDQQFSDLLLYFNIIILT